MLSWPLGPGSWPSTCRVPRPRRPGRPAMERCPRPCRNIWSSCIRQFPVTPACRARDPRRPPSRVPRAGLPGRHDQHRPGRPGQGRLRHGVQPAVPDRQGKKGVWTNIGPEPGAVPVHRAPQLVQLRAQRVRGGRPDDLDRDQPRVPAVPVPGLDHPGRRRRVGHRRHPGRRAEVVLPRRPARHQRRRRGHDRPQRPDRQHHLRRHRRGEHLRFRLRGRRRASTSPPTAALTWTGPLGKDELGGKGIGEIVIKPGDPKTIYVGTTTALRGMSSVCCTGVTRPVPGRGEVGPLQVHRRRPDLVVHPQRIGRTPPSAPAAPTEFTNSRDLLAARRAPRRARPEQLEHRLRLVLRARHLALARRRRDLDPDQAVAQRRRSSRPAPPFDVTKLPNGKTRMYVHEGNIGTPYSRLFRSDDVATGAPDVHRPDQRQRGRPRLRDVTTSAPGSAGTTCSSHARTATRTWSTPAARTATARPSPTSGPWSCPPTPA